MKGRNERPLPRKRNKLERKQKADAKKLKTNQTEWTADFSDVEEEDESGDDEEDDDDDDIMDDDDDLEEDAGDVDDFFYIFLFF